MGAGDRRRDIDRHWRIKSTKQTSGTAPAALHLNEPIAGTTTNAGVAPDDWKGELPGPQWKPPVAKVPLTQPFMQSLGRYRSGAPFQLNLTVVVMLNTKLNIYEAPIFGKKFSVNYNQS